MRKVIVLLGLLWLAGCGVQSSAPPMARMSQESDAALPPAGAAEAPAGINAPGAAGAAGDADVAAVPRKIIYTAHVDVVVPEFADLPEQVAALVEKHGGYISSSNLQGSSGAPRAGSWTIRVPVEQYDALLAGAKELGELRSAKSDSQEVTEEYYDLEARIRNKKQEEERLLKHLEDSTGDLEQILAVERELSRVRGEVEQMQGRLRVLSNLTSLATVHLRVEEIKDYVPPQAPTYTTRVSRAFDDSLGNLSAFGQNVSIALVYAAPWLGMLLVLGLAAGIVGRIGLGALRRKSR